MEVIMKKIFEKELKLIFGKLKLEDIFVCNNMLIGKLNEKNIVKIQFDDCHCVDCFGYIRIDIINKEIGTINSDRVLLKDIFQTNADSNYKPHIYKDNNGHYSWYVEPTDDDRRNLFEYVDKYLNYFK